MDRLCGASGERDTLSQQRCWCHGLFCGPGGALMTQRFVREFHTFGRVASRADAEALMQQADLFDGSTGRGKWIARMDAHGTPRTPWPHATCSHCGLKGHGARACPHRHGGPNFDHASTPDGP